MPKDQRSKQIRDIQRLLTLDTLPPQVRIDKERHLASLQHEKEQAKQSTIESKLERKYKLVKFVEHQKAVRKLRQAEKQLATAVAASHSTDSAPAAAPATTPDSSSATSRTVSECREAVRLRQRDVRYIEHYPALEKYISLYKLPDASDETESAQRSRARRTEILELAGAGTLRRKGAGSGPGTGGRGLGSTGVAAPTVKIARSLAKGKEMLHDRQRNGRGGKKNESAVHIHLDDKNDGSREEVDDFFE